ncbi:alpha/beta hydrolase [uncultured Planococcus sp.]|uniref:alpha/beta fold hydrolase n=1 Tax=uncultured Planococcus sp. TaxID=337815 RepID=UPI00262A33E0|nr:alpha/beta hydrolase [uncultured Planococcus sp.]
MSKDNLVLLPGTLCDARQWEHQIDHLSAIADITIGDVTSGDTLKEMANTVLAKAPAKFSLAGLSLGGMVALEIIKQAPERVNRLALLNTNPTGPKPEQRTAWNGFINLVNEGRFNEITKDHLLPYLVHPNHLTNVELTSAIIEMAEAVGPDAYLRQLHAVATRINYVPYLQSIPCPTLILVGKEDTICPVSLHKEMHDHIPNSGIIIVKECGHLSSMEQPEAVTNALREWLSKV